MAIWGANRLRLLGLGTRGTDAERAAYWHCP